MKTAVAKKIGPPRDAIAGNAAAACLPRALATKKRTSGPSSNSNLSQGLSFFSAGVCG